ncbi:MAG: T9SS type A sorting domain-containing protein, partial [Spirosomaceae bacterium]|nr:T9SS type A sorting domain-containing protein [Spirosomataceae bacterium]
GKGLASPDPADNGATIVAFDNNQIALLRSPIILDSDRANATISFNEVVLVEPGEAGTTFEDQEFWDYVVVEGSTDGGQSWTPFADGYDSRDDNGWLNRFNSTLSAGGAPVSNGRGEQALYKPRVINIYDGEFSDVAPGTEVIVRFRLFSDQWVRGWGWAIDDLRLQIPAPKPLASENPVFKELTVSPTPSTDFIKLAYTFQRPQEVHVEVFSVNGGKLLNERVETVGNNFNFEIDVRNYNAGTYVVKVTGIEGFKAKKFIVTK